MTKFFDIESHACDAVCAASILLNLVQEHFSKDPSEYTGSANLYRLSPQQADNLIFAACQVNSLVVATKKAFQDAAEELCVKGETK
ncbi:hypothetical protein [Brucella gallinifaecis]|uniref:hypothetical protein n=1 Tax=Brucella gallinifaecis TaxID=215590 RepID=UPI00236100FE|nr:hypothetical protein [Brucella gallinifaecis]